jgi:acid stress-induced BolA-like protein IbaG/YrbA
MEEHLESEVAGEGSHFFVEIHSQQSPNQTQYKEEKSGARHTVPGVLAT